MRKVRAKILRKIAVNATKGQPLSVTTSVYRKIKKRWTRTHWTLRNGSTVTFT